MANKISTLVFVDSKVADYETLVNNVKPGTKVIILDGDRDGIEQITEILTNCRNLDSFQIVSHGDVASLQLGNSSLNSSNLDSYQPQLQQWKKALTKKGDILLLGCKVAEDGLGKSFINRLSELTKADVAASDDLTGNKDLGGDWKLKASTGLINAPLAFQIQALSAFNSVLQTFTVTNTNDSGVGSLRQAIIDAENNNNSNLAKDIIDLSAISGNRLILNSALPTITEQVEIQGNNVEVNGLLPNIPLQYSQLFSIDAETSTTQINLFNLKLTNGRAVGGNGSTGAGGGLGAGGALFINKGQVVVDNIAFTTNLAIGGNSSSGINGGGLGSYGSPGGNGGLFNKSSLFSGGFGGSGGTRSGDSGNRGGDGSAGDFGVGGGAGGGGGGATDGSFGSDPSDDGGNGGNGGIGGFGAGGGGGGGGGKDYDYYSGNEHGNGGNGAGGGAFGGAGSNGEYGGGSRSTGLGGGGAGLGGAIFVNSDANLVLLNSSFSNNSTIGGTGYQNGSALGNDIFVRGSASAVNTYIGDAYGTVNSFSLPTISILANSLDLSEPSSNNSFYLDVYPSFPIDLTVNYIVSGTAINGTDYNSVSNSVVIPAGNTSASIDLSVIDDAVFETSESITVTLQDANNYNLEPFLSSATYSITDDEPTITLTGTANATEGGNKGEFTFNLSPAAPNNRNVKFKISGGSATLGTDYRLLKADGSVLTADSNGNYTLDISNRSSVVVRVDATGVTGSIPDYDDNIDENNETVEITLNSSTEYSGSGTASLSIIDNDKPPTISLVAVTNPTETGTTGIIDVDLSSKVLLGSATVNYGVSGTGVNPNDYSLLLDIDGVQSNLSGVGGSFTLLEGKNSNSNIQIKVVPNDDSIFDPGETVTVTLGSGSGYVLGNSSATLTIQDNEVIPSASISSDLAIAQEGDVLNFKINLSSPALFGGAVVNYSIAGTATNGTDFKILSGKATIAEGKQELVIPVSSLEDLIAEGAETIVISLNSGTGYTVQNQTLTLTITDDDTPGIIINPLSGSTTEAGGEVVFEVVLTSEPTSEVTLDLQSNDLSEGLVNLNALIFNETNWDEAQSFTVTGVDDNLEDGDINYSIATTTSSNDKNYNAIAVADVSLVNIDDDGFGVLITASGGTTKITEGGTTDSYSLALSQTPVGKVEITVTADEQTEISSDGVTFSDSLIVTFSDITAQTITVKAKDDVAVEGTHFSTVTHQVSGEVIDSRYGADLEIADVTVEIADNDSPTVTILSTQDASEESLVVGQFNLALSDPAPTGGVTVNYSVNVANSTAANSDYEALSGKVLIKAGETGATINLVPVQDLITEIPPETVVINLAAGSGYKLGTTTTGTVKINDDDLAGVRITESGNQTDLVEGQKSDTYSLELTSQPNSDVTINFITNSTQINSINSVTFTPENWQTKQTITVISVDDNQVLGDRTSTISHTAVSSDSNYNGIAIADVNASITENDTPGIVIANANNLQLTEGEAGVSYTVALTTQPLNDVTLNFGTSADLEAITPITFTTANWNIPQTVTVAAVVDTEVEPIEIQTITHSLVSNDAIYNGLEVPGVKVAINELTFDNTETASSLEDSLAAIQDSIDQQFSDIELPFIGSLTTLAPDLIGSFKDSLINAIQTTGELNSEDISALLEEKIEDALDIDATVSTDLSLEEATFDITLGKTYDLASLALDGDLGLPGLGINVDGSADLTFDYQFDLGFGINQDFGFFIDTEKTSFNAATNFGLSDDFQATGNLGFLKLDLTDDADNPTAATLEFDLGLNDLDADPDNDFDGDRLTISELRNGSLNDLFDPSASANVNLGLSAVTSIEGDTAFPSFNFNLAGDFPVLNYADGEATGPQKPTIAFNDVSLDLGTFLTDFTAPVISGINDVIEPFRPIIDFLNKDTQLISQIGLDELFDKNGDGKVSVLELALKIAELGGKTPKANYIEFFDAVVEISDLVEELNTLVEGGDTITIDLGSYELGSGFNASDPNAEATEAVAETTKAAPSLNQQLDSAPNTGTRPTQKNIIKNLTVSGNTFEIPLLTNPLTAIDLLLGKDVPLFTYDLPALEVGFEVEKEFPIWGPISGLLEGDFNVAIDLAFGFDTYGLRQWQETTDFAPLEAYRVLDGFYVSDRENADGTGEDIAELVASATVAAGLGLDVVIASGYVKGGLEGIIGIDLIDGGEINGSDDGRIRASEISDRIMTPWELFQLSGVVNAFLGAEVKVGPPGFRETVWEKRFATFQLAEFSLGPKGTSASSVFDGVIVGGKVFFDANFNAEHDATEPFTFTNADGSYSLEIPLYIYDLNTNGAINPEEGRVIIVDGIDSSTSLPQIAPIFTTPDATVATPLTSLTTEVAEPDFTASQAQVIAGFKLPSNSNLYEYEAANADLQLFATQAQLQNLIILATQAIAVTAFTGETINSHALLIQEGLIYLDNNDNGQFDEDDLEISLTETGTRYFDLDGDKQLDSGELNSPVNEADIATAIINAIAAKIDNGETPDLSDTATIEAIIAEAIAAIETKDANIAFNTTELATLSQSIIEKNTIIDTILGNSFLTETEQKQQIVNQWVFIDTNNNGTLDSNEPYSFVNGEGTDELDITPYDTNNNGELDVRVIVTENAPEWVFFDSNGNGTHESSEPFSIVHASGDSDLEVNYLDSNNNGVQDNYEPFSISHSFGTTEVAIAPFDSNNNGVLEPDERTNLILKGTVLNQWSFVDSNGNGEFNRDETFSVIYNDGSDELNSLIEATKVYVDSAESPELAAGFQHLVINPLGTISRLLAESKGTAAAQQEVKKALGIPDVDLLNYDPLQAIADGEENGLEIYAKQVRVQNTIVQIEALGSSDTEIIDGLVEQIENNKTIDLNNPTQVEDLIKELIPDLEPEVNTGAANVITEANQLIDEIISEPESNDIEKATEIAKVQQVAQGDITKDLKDLASGKKSVAEVVSENTGTELTQQVENAEAEDPTERPDLTNNLPVAETDTATTDAGKPVTIDVLANDTHPDNDTLAIKDFSPPNNGTVAINADNTITYTPKNGFTGEDAFFYLVEDSNQDVANAMVLVKVNSSPNNPPVAVDDAVTTVVNQAIAISLAELLANDTDVNEDTLSITAVNNPINGTVELDKDKITFIPNSGYKGKASFDYTVSDGKGGEDIGTVNVTVNSLLNNPPFLNQLLGDRTVLEDKSFSFGISANTFKDIDPQDKLTYSATLANGQPLPKWLIFNPRTRFFGGKTTNADVGVVDVKVTAKDKSGASASDSFQITVQNVNDSPYFNQAIGDRIAIENRAFQLVVHANTFKDVDLQDKLTYSATLDNGKPLPKWLSFDSTNLTLSGTPKDANVGVLDLKIAARDLAGKSAQTQFKLTVFNLVQGTPGADNLKGLDRRDFLTGEASNDTLRGGKGDDILEGGAGNDLMFGEAGKDRFSFAGQEAFNSNNLGVDRIADFQLGDRIALSKTVFTALSTSVNSQLLASDFVVISTDSNSEMSQAASQSAVIVYNSVTGSILYNENRTENGLGDGSKFVSVDGAFSLSHNSFSVIQ